MHGPWDALPRGRTPHALVLMYKLSLQEGGTASISLTILFFCAGYVRCTAMGAHAAGADAAQPAGGRQSKCFTVRIFCFVQGPRDALPRGRTPHALMLTYKLSLQEGGKITPRLPMMNG